MLSDAKARAKYDATGRTSKLTAEEEFIEAFRKGREEPREEVREEPREEVKERRRFAWGGERQEPPQQQRRSGGVHSFSAQLPEKRPETGGFEVGAKVRIVGLEKQQHLNSAMGILVKPPGSHLRVAYAEVPWRPLAGALGRRSG